jgi:hypothetical protein
VQKGKAASEQHISEQELLDALCSPKPSNYHSWWRRLVARPFYLVYTVSGAPPFNLAELLAARQWVDEFISGLCSSEPSLKCKFYDCVHAHSLSTSGQLEALFSEACAEEKVRRTEKVRLDLRSRGLHEGVGPRA